MTIKRLKIGQELDVTYTCREVSISCSINYYDKNGLSLPPCCLNVLTGLTFAVISEFQKANLSMCLYCGQVLASLKMPGGQLPWDTDVDSPHFGDQFDQVLEKS